MRVIHMLPSRTPEVTITAVMSISRRLWAGHMPAAQRSHHPNAADGVGKRMQCSPMIRVCVLWVQLPVSLPRPPLLLPPRRPLLQLQHQLRPPLLRLRQVESLSAHRSQICLTLEFCCFILFPTNFGIGRQASAATHD